MTIYENNINKLEKKKFNYYFKQSKIISKVLIKLKYCTQLILFYTNGTQSLVALCCHVVHKPGKSRLLKPYDQKF